MSARKIVFRADEEISTALEFLGMAQRALHRAANTMATAPEVEIRDAVKITYDARYLAKQIQGQAEAVVKIRDLTRKQGGAR